MTAQQYVQALHDLQKPLVVQQKVVAAVAKQYGTGSYQYKQEFAKECRIVQANFPQEMRLYWQFMASLLEEKMKKDGKTATLALIVQQGKAAPEADKTEWRKIYKQIESL